jgi:hypothetical protein
VLGTLEQILRVKVRVIKCLKLLVGRGRFAHCKRSANFRNRVIDTRRESLSFIDLYEGYVTMADFVLPKLKLQVAV